MAEPGNMPTKNYPQMESPLGPLKGSNESVPVSGDPPYSIVWILADFVAPFVFANVLFWPLWLFLGSVFSGSRSLSDTEALVVGALGAFTGLVVLVVGGGVYGWLIGSRYFSPKQFAKYPDVRAATKSARGLRRTLVILQCLYFPACVFGGCTGFFIFAGLFIG